MPISCVNLPKTFLKHVKFRFTSIYAANCAVCMRTIVFLTSSSVVGTVQIVQS